MAKTESSFDTDLADLEHRIKNQNPNFNWLVVIGFFVFVFWLTIPYVVAHSHKLDNTKELTPGTIGDSFGSVNALFAGLAFGALIWTMYQTNRELNLQKQVAILQIKELQKSTESMKEQATAQQTMTKAISTQSVATALNAEISTKVARLQKTVSMYNHANSVRKRTLLTDEISTLSEELRQHGHAAGMIAQISEYFQVGKNSDSIQLQTPEAQDTPEDKTEF